jgi:hypothetical protein
MKSEVSIHYGEELCYGPLGKMDRRRNPIFVNAQFRQGVE